MSTCGPYVLITPVKNEEQYIGQTLESVVRQTVRPLEWVIVSDGSTDRTDEIVQAAAADNPWIRLLKMPVRVGRNFAAVVHATEAGLRFMIERNYAYLGLLDSDVRFQPDYFERVIGYFKAAPLLGLAGGAVIDVGLPKTRLPRNRQDVPGAAQFFRRECFEKLGGLIAIPEGGWDALTCARARMAGYETRLLTVLIIDHLKPRNVAEGGVFRRKWQLGVRDYALGYHPLFELVKCIGRWYDHPLLLAAVSWWLGYCYALVQRRPRLIPDDLLQFVRAEQASRLKRVLRLERRSEARPMPVSSN